MGPGAPFRGLALNGPRQLGEQTDILLANPEDQPLVPDLHELVLAVERLLDGRTCPRPDLARAPVAPVPGVPAAPDVLGLTRRQSDVLALLAQGKPNKLICRDLRLSEGTVKVHVSAILRALNVHTRAQAIAELARRGVGTSLFARS